MVKNTLNINFDDGILDTFQSTDTLCISKKVNNAFNVVFDNAAATAQFDGQKTLLQNNEFQFFTDYKLYFVKKYTNDALIESHSSPKAINIGQSINWTGHDLGSASAADATVLDSAHAKTSFAVTHAPSNFHVAVQASTGDTYTTIFVDPDNHMGSGNIVLTPKNEFCVYWFNLKDSEMIHEVFAGDVFTFSFPSGNSSLTIRFGYAVPNTKSPGEEAAFHIDS